MNFPANDLPPLAIGQHVHIIHLPSLGPEIRIQGTIVQCQHPVYWLDTEHQKRIKVERKYLQE